VAVDQTTFKRKLKLLSAYVPDDVPPEIVRLDYGPRDVYLYVTSRVERKTRVRSCEKEPWTVRWIETRVKPGDIFYDIGANVGPYTLIAGQYVGQTGRVVAIEPSYSSFAHLCDNIILNDLSDLVIPVGVAVGRANERTRFHYNSLAPGHARHSLTAEPPSEREDRQVRASLHALALSLDTLADLFRLPLPTHMKIDVDGTELDVLYGGERMLASPSLQSVMVEVEHVNTEEMLALFARHGFSVSERHQRVDEEGRPAGWWFGVFARGGAAPRG
jgi:FkbM family methyltransferase